MCGIENGYQGFCSRAYLTAKLGLRRANQPTLTHLEWIRALKLRPSVSETRMHYVGMVIGWCTLGIMFPPLHTRIV